MSSEDLIKNVEINSGEKFYYDEDEVYEAFSKTSKELLVIGNLKTGFFKYPVEVANLLGLSSQIVKNPLHYWEKLVLKEDWDKFYRSVVEFRTGENSYQCLDFRVNSNNKILLISCVGNLI